MSPTHRAAEQSHFGGATPGEAQAENGAAEEAMIDSGSTDGASPEEIVRSFFEAVFNEGEDGLEAIERFVAADHLNHDPTAPQVPPGPQGVRELARYYREAFPDLRYEIEDIVAAGDRVAHRWVLTGSQMGEIMGIAPTGRPVRMEGLEINRIDRGKIAESWAIGDAMGLRGQLQS